MMPDSLYHTFEWFKKISQKVNAKDCFVLKLLKEKLKDYVKLYCRLAGLSLPDQRAAKNEGLNPQMQTDFSPVVSPL